METQPPNAVKWHPVDLTRACRKDHYITGIQALNLWDRQSGPDGGTADWHEPAALWTRREGERGDHANLDITVPWRSLGEDGIEDARKALRGPGHPAAQSAMPIWKATHARAVVDLAFHRCQREDRTLWNSSRFGPIAPWTVADWIWTESQMKKVREYAARATTEIEDKNQQWWTEWWQSLRFGTDHRDYVKTDA